MKRLIAVGASSALTLAAAPALAQSLTATTPAPYNDPEVQASSPAMTDADRTYPGDQSTTRSYSNVDLTADQFIADVAAEAPRSQWVEENGRWVYRTTIARPDAPGGDLNVTVVSHSRIPDPFNENR